MIKDNFRLRSLDLPIKCGDQYCATDFSKGKSCPFLISSKFGILHHCSIFSESFRPEDALKSSEDLSPLKRHDRCLALENYEKEKQSR